MFLKWRQPGSLFGKILAAHLVVILITLLAIGFFLSYLMEKYFFSAREWELTAQAEKAANLLSQEFKTGSYTEVEKMAKTLAVSMNIKITVINQGKRQVVMASPMESNEDPEIDLEESEIKYILQGNNLTKKLYGPQMQRLLVAIPITESPIDPESTETPNVLGAITVTAPLTGVQATIAQVGRLTAYSGVFAIIIAGIMAFSLAKGISRPLQAMIKAARELVKGNFRSRIDIKAQGELGELAATFNQAVVAVEKTVEQQKHLQVLRQNLVTNVSHEFRAPLTSIQGFVEAILEGFIAEEEKEKYLQIILDNTIHLNRLVNDLLELSSIESGNINLVWEVLSPKAVAHRAVSSMASKAREKEINLQYQCEPELALIEGDRDRLHQILINLLENAIACTPAGGNILLTCTNKHGKITFSVIDNGIGIPPEELPYIWDRFYKVDKARNKAQKGKGLGLAIVQELVQLHKGQIAINSKLGLGSTFSVILPAYMENVQ
ncbi:MAG: ATP-binding protein [bacterium]|jgi:signal transduction histidine kinase